MSDSLHHALLIRFPSNPDANALSDLAAALIDDYAPRGTEERGEAWMVYFRSADVRDQARSAIERAFGPSGVTATPADVGDEDWAARSQADLHAVRIGRVIVCPPWDIPDPHESIRIVIEPSTGFGTGHHPSTRLCLRLLQEIEVVDRTVLDIGTGSGVLAIAATKLGARAVLAVDDDPDAVEAARRNLSLNGVEAVVDLELADFTTLECRPADVVLANLTGAVLAAHAGRFRTWVQNGGLLIVSGFTEGEEPSVRAAFAAADVRGRAVEDTWVALCLEARGVSMMT